MSQPDLAHALRAAKPVAPGELRERVHLVAVQAAPPPRRHVTWRRALVVAIPVAAVVAAGVALTRPSHRAAQPPVSFARPAFSSGATALKPSPKRVQRYTASLDLRVPTAAAVSADSQRAVAIARSLGGYEQSVNVNTRKLSGYASIRLRVPKAHIQEAVRRLSALGTIVGENVGVQDLTSGLNATSRKIQSLQRELRALRAGPQTVYSQRRVLQLTEQIQKLQQSETSTHVAASYATVALTLTTPPKPAPAKHHHGPLHGLGVAFRWIGIGAVYALAIGTPFVLLALAARAFRRRREAQLLSRS